MLYPIWSYNRNARLESWTCPFRRDMNELIKNRFYCTNLPDISLLLLPWQYVCFAFVTTKTMALKCAARVLLLFPLSQLNWTRISCLIYTCVPFIAEGRICQVTYFEATLCAVIFFLFEMSCSNQFSQAIKICLDD